MGLGRRHCPACGGPHLVRVRVRAREWVRVGVRVAALPGMWWATCCP